MGPRMVDCPICAKYETKYRSDTLSERDYKLYIVHRVNKHPDQVGPTLRAWVEQIKIELGL